VTGAAQPAILLGLTVAPGLPEDVAAEIAEELAEDLHNAYGSVDWRTEIVVDRLVSPPVPTTEIFDAARRKLLERDWDLSVVITDLPLRRGRLPVTRHVSPAHGIAVLSLPALGAINLAPRVRRALFQLVGELIGDVDRRASDWNRNVLRELAKETGERPRGLFVPAVLLGNLRLLLGMVRANRPWRLAARLYGALVAAGAVAVYGIVSSDVWRLSAAMDWWRLAVASLVAITITVTAIVLVHGLWERPPERRVRDQVVLFNVVTAITLVIGIFCLYAALFGLILAGAALVITPGTMTNAIGHPASAADYVSLAWFLSSLAILGGALGAGLESDEAVREAAYAAPVSEAEEAA
jgi:hypothetical protein